MSEWKVENIATLANGKKAKDISSDALYPIYGGNGIMGYTNSFNASNVVIIGRVGAYCGSVHYSKEKCWISDNAISAMAKDNNSTEYLHYLLTSLHLNRHHIGGAQPLMTQGIINNIDIPKHSNSEQKKIAGILSALDEKIETNRKINTRLEELAQALVKSWFIDFEPFGGKMPEDWEPTPFSKLVDNIGGYSYKGDELQDSDVAMVTIKNFDRNGSFKSDGFKEIIVSSKCKPEQHAGIFDVMVAHTDLTQNADIIGNPILILATSNYRDLVYSMDLTKVVSKNHLLSNFIIYHILKAKDFKGHALGYVNGTTVLHMSKKAVPEYEAYLPQDLNILRPLHHALKPIYEQISVRLMEIERLTSLRDTLLPKLMSGELIPE